MARDLCGHGGWLPWLEKEFDWSEMTATRYMNLYALSLKSNTVLDLDFPLGALYLLAARSTPPEVVDNIIERAEAGEEITRNTVTFELRKRSVSIAPHVIDVTPHPVSIAPPAPIEVVIRDAEDFLRQEQDTRAWNDAERRHYLQAEEAIDAILKFGRAAKDGLEVRTMRSRLAERGCEAEFVDALGQTCAMLKWIRAQ
jgi:hypothetical protein